MQQNADQPQLQQIQILDAQPMATECETVNWLTDEKVLSEMLACLKLRLTFNAEVIRSTYYRYRCGAALWPGLRTQEAPTSSQNKQVSCATTPGFIPPAANITQGASYYSCKNILTAKSSPASSSGPSFRQPQTQRPRRRHKMPLLLQISKDKKARSQNDWIAPCPFYLLRALL